jgi:hypothetical protein
MIEIKGFNTVYKDQYNDQIKLGEGGFSCEIYYKGKLQIIASGTTKELCMLHAIDILKQWDWLEHK